jgi:hypothetical protein
MNVFEINAPEWSTNDMRAELKEFFLLYKNRPIKNNEGGMRFSHMFALYFILKKINPELVVESGIYKGQSTWLIESTLPHARIISIDLDLSNREYISNKSTYSNVDFKFQDFSSIPSNSLVFFDDHQNAVDRLMQSKWFSFKHVIFEDNYIPTMGDNYTIKHAIEETGNIAAHKIKYKHIFSSLFYLVKELIKKKFLGEKYFSSLDPFSLKLNDVKENRGDKKIIIKNIETYFEFPPIVEINFPDSKRNSYPKKKPILENQNDLLESYSEIEKNYYNWILYIKLK